MNIEAKVFEQPTLFVMASMLLCTTLALTGCIPMIIGAVAYSGAQSDATKQKFLDDFNKTNLEREKAGFKPLDYCIELRRLDAKLAEQDSECKKQAEIAAKEIANPAPVVQQSVTQITITSDTPASLEPQKPAQPPQPPLVPKPKIEKE